MSGMFFDTQFSVTESELSVRKSMDKTACSHARLMYSTPSLSLYWYKFLHCLFDRQPVN